MLKKCDYCAKEISYFEQYCCVECNEKTNRFYEMSEKFEKIFGIVNVICVFGIPVGIFLFPFANLLGAIIASLSCFILGLMVVLLPFPTENMISKFKLKKAMKITRIIGCCVIFLGILILGFYFLMNISF